jgi:hypothetical protein
MALTRSPGVTRRVALAPDDSGRCPDFPPASPSCDGSASDHPAHPLTTLYREPRWRQFPVWDGCLTPPPLFHKSLILRELCDDIVQECDFKWVGGAWSVRGTPNVLINRLSLGIYEDWTRRSFSRNFRTKRSLRVDLGIHIRLNPAVCGATAATGWCCGTIAITWRSGACRIRIR